MSTLNRRIHHQLNKKALIGGLPGTAGTTSTTAAAQPTTSAAPATTTSTDDGYSWQFTPPWMTETSTQGKTSTTSTTTPVAATTTSTTSAAIGTTTSTTSTTTSTSDIPTTTSSTPSLPTTTSTTSIAPIVLPTSNIAQGTSTYTATFTGGASALDSSSTTLSSPSSTSTSSSHTGALVGGIGAGILGIAGVAIVVAFLVRRWRKRAQEDVDFDPGNFRRSAVLVADEFDGPKSGGTGAYGITRAPSMAQRAARTPVAYNPGPEEHAAYPQQEYGYNQQYGQPSFSPGQMMHMPDSPGSAPGTAQPFFPGVSPMGSPTVDEYGSAYDQNGRLVRQSSNGGYLQRQPSMLREPAYPAGGPGAHYVDLSRSSVTPFQAQQYEEISRKLGHEDSAGAPLRVVNENEESPFDDPSHSYIVHDGDAVGQASTMDGPHMNYNNDYPNSPVYALHSPATPSRARIDSMPPRLPDAGMNFPNSPLVASFGDARTGNSPVKQTFQSTMSTGGEHQGMSAVVHDAGPVPRASSARVTAPEPTKTRAVSVYDDEDAYGGI